MAIDILHDQRPSDLLETSVAHGLPGLDQRWQRLTGGRVNLLWRVGQVVIKQFRASGISPLFPNDPSAEAAALTLLAPYELAPKLLARGQDWLAYEFRPGRAWRSDTTIVARALGNLHRLTVPAHSFRLGANGSAQLLEQAKAIAALCKSHIGPPPPDNGVASGPTCLIHGDAVPGNLIALNGKITFIDWQCPAIGDPAEDIATFLSPAMQYLYRGTPLSQAEVSAFRAACPAPQVERYDQLAAIYHWRMAAHCLWKAEHGAPDYGKAMNLELESLNRLPQHDPH
jgi:hypothetical protein